MKKPITLQYTIDENQLPSETSRLLSNSISRLTSIVATVPKQSDIMSVTTVNEVDALRDELSSIDIMLGDVSSIIDQYIQYQHQLRMAQQTGDLEPPDEYEIPDFSDVDLSDLSAEEIQSKLSQLSDIETSGIKSFNDATDLLPGLKTRAIKTNADSDTQQHNSKREEMEEQLQKVTEFKEMTAGLEDADAIKLLSEMNNMDFTDVENIGTHLQSLQAKIGKK